jgi:hypothetical protein
MKFVSAIFLVLLIAPFAYSQRDLIEMIEKSSEGKQVLDKVFLEVALTGNKFDHHLVRNIVHTINTQALTFRKVSLKFLRSEKRICKAQLKATSLRFQEFTIRSVFTKSMLTELRKGQQTKGTILKRGAYLFRMYKRFLTMSRSSEKAWKGFWTKGRQSYRRVASLISQVRAHVRRLHRSHHKRALIQLPKDYQDAMLEISTQFESNFDELAGIRPIISNLLEVVRSPKHLKKKHTRVSVRRMLGWLAYHVHAWSNRFSEEAEHQKGIFHGLVGIFTTRVNSQSKVIQLVSSEAKRNAKKISHVIAQVRSSSRIAAQAGSIVRLVRHECEGFTHEISHILVTSGRVLNYASQLEEVVAERWPSLKSYFLEKLEAIEERA